MLSRVQDGYLNALQPLFDNVRTLMIDASYMVAAVSQLMSGTDSHTLTVETKGRYACQITCTAVTYAALIATIYLPKSSAKNASIGHRVHCHVVLPREAPRSG